MRPDPILTKQLNISNPPIPNLNQLHQLRRHDPAAAARAERLLAAGLIEAARHRIRQSMHHLLDRSIAAQKAGSAEVQS